MYGLNALNNIQYSILNSSRFNFEFRSDALHETKTETNTVYSLLDYCDYGQNEGIFYSLAHRGGDGRDDDDDDNERRQTKRPNIFAYPSFYLTHKKNCRQYLCQRPSSILLYDWRCYLQLSNLKDIDTLHFFHNIISFCTSFTKQMDLTIDGNYEMDQHNLRWGMLKSENWSCIDCTLETCTKLSFSHYSNCFCKSFAEVTEKIADIIKIHLVFVLALATISSWQSV